MIYQLVNKRTEVSPLATSHIVRLCNQQFNHVFALLISIALIFIKIHVKLNYFSKKCEIFDGLGAQLPDPQNRLQLQISGYAPVFCSFFFHKDEHKFISTTKQLLNAKYLHALVKFVMTGNQK